MDDSQRAVRCDAPATDAYATAAATGNRSWPVLARIGDVESREALESNRRIATKASPTPGQRTFRVDSPHVTVAGQADAGADPPTANDTKSNAKPKAARRPRGILHRLPGVIRFAIRAWLVLYPYRSVIRAASMLVLMGVTGATTMVMLGGNLGTDSTPPNTTSAAAESPEQLEPATNTGVLEPAVEPIAPPELPTTSAAPPVPTPTASGPTGAPRQELVAIKTDATEPANAVGEVAEESTQPASTPVFAAYPTTPYPSTTYGTEAGPALPRVQTENPTPSVARLEGGIEQVLPPR